MKVALVTTAPSVTSGIGDYTRHLVPYLREHVDLDIYVAPEGAGEDYLGQPALSALDLRPKSADQVLYQIGNERAHAFMLPILRAIGGTVVQHDWILFDLATAAYPELERGGLGAHVRAWREGGLEALRVYRENRRARRAGSAGLELAGDGVLLGGWNAPEPDGRWTTRRAGVRVPVHECLEVEVAVASCTGSSVRALEFGRERARANECPHELRFRVEDATPGVFVLAVDGVRATGEQRAAGDTRELGAFVTRIRYRDPSGWHDVDLTGPAALPAAPVELSSARFELPLNRSVVRWGDAFLVHSEWMRKRILVERNAITSAALVHHGAERRWRDEDRALARGRLGLDDTWCRGLLAVSFGAVQDHKRVDQVLRGLAQARKTHPELRLVLAGEVRTERIDVPALITELGLENAVHVTGWVEESAGHDWLHAADVCINLRGPSTGGTSGGIFQALAAGRGVIASYSGEQNELPNTCVLKVPVGGGEVRALAGHLTDLASDVARRDALEEAARAFVETECHWSHVAKRYAELLAAFPAHRTNRKSLITSAIEGADCARAEREGASERGK
ncbi:MAG: glycosyltransferase family 4 protein [bacterium]|nr:glycosyltransferase family 4 protein [bacterium]